MKKHFGFFPVIALLFGIQFFTGYQIAVGQEVLAVSTNYTSCDYQNCSTPWGPLEYLNITRPDFPGCTFEVCVRKRICEGVVEMKILKIKPISTSCPIDYNVGAIRDYILYSVWSYNDPYGILPTNFGTSRTIRIYMSPCWAIATCVGCSSPQEPPAAPNPEAPDFVWWQTGNFLYPCGDPCCEVTYTVQKTSDPCDQFPVFKYVELNKAFNNHPTFEDCNMKTHHPDKAIEWSIYCPNYFCPDPITDCIPTCNPTTVEEIRNGIMLP